VDDTLDRSATLLDVRVTAAMLNNREWASLFWLAVLAGFLAYKRVLGPILRPSFHAFVRPPIVGLMIALSCYTVGLVYVGYRSGIWTTDVLKDTVLWFLVAGLPFVFGISGSAKRGYLARAAVRSIQVTALLEFYLNLFVFNNMGRDSLGTTSSAVADSSLGPTS